jgi:MFS family permease
MFALFYVILAPFVGAFADAMPKGKVMFISNAIKVVGCLMMLFGGHPLLAYAIVGLGAAAYSPAKYGILTELLPASQLVKANGWIEGLTIASIILGVLLGGQLVGAIAAHLLLGFDLPLPRHRHRHPAEAAISLLILIYVVAALFNLRIPRTGRGAAVLPRNPLPALVRDFWTATRACGATSWARSRWPPPRCSGASRATCATSCSPGRQPRWATAPRRPRRWWAWWPSARRWARWWPRCACGWTRPPRVIPLGIGMGCCW